MKMLNVVSCIIAIMIILAFNTSTAQQNDKNTKPKQNIRDKIHVYAPTKIKADLKNLTNKQKELVRVLTDAGKLADAIFWRQNTPDGIRVRDSLYREKHPDAKELRDYVNINYGPYDVLNNNERFTGKGPLFRPACGSFYPEDMTKAEFEKFITDNPNLKVEFESQYTIILRDNKGLKAMPYHIAYPEVEQLAMVLEKAAKITDDPELKKYLELRAKAVRTDDYFESDMAWMDVNKSDIDLIIGPIENYRDELYNYKTSYEAVVMVRDVQATKEFEILKSKINQLEQMLPCDKKYKRESAGGESSQLNIMNVVYFGGDCQEGIKTIAASLPNDPIVREKKGGKNSMFKNMMEAKFEKIVVPIANRLLEPEQAKLADAKAFSSFVTLHEISHTLGRGYVYGSDDLTVRKALKERFSSIEECKADILSMYNHKVLMEMGVYDQDYVNKAMATYLAGLYRSIRFGGDAHGTANLIQLNYLLENKAIIRLPNGKLKIDKSLFFDKVSDLANMILMTEFEGNYNGAGKIIENYGKMNPDLEKDILRLSDIPRDLNTTYDY
jgi:hypothetical protein